MEIKETEALRDSRVKASELGFNDIKIVSAEFSLDGARLLFIYSSEEGEKTDLKMLKRAMQRTYQQTHVEMHLVGPRDVAKALGGLGACGLQCRCCSAFLTEFSPISIKMAKEQGISLTPTEITGMCGRLRCCLVYEYEHYVEARKQLPKRGKLVVTPKGNGKVNDVNPLKGTILVELDQGGRFEFLKGNQPLEELDALIIKQMIRVRTALMKNKVIPREKESPMENQKKPLDDWEAPQRFGRLTGRSGIFCGATITRWVNAGIYYFIVC
jgi:cell fate regulator YaaT (PSP1 superfamily)